MSTQINNKMTQANKTNQTTQGNQTSQGAMFGSFVPLNPSGNDNAQSIWANGGQAIWGTHINWPITKATTSPTAAPEPKTPNNATKTTPIAKVTPTTPIASIGPSPAHRPVADPRLNNRVQQWLSQAQTPVGGDDDDDDIIFMGSRPVQRERHQTLRTVKQEVITSKGYSPRESPRKRKAADAGLPGGPPPPRTTSYGGHQDLDVEEIPPPANFGNPAVPALPVVNTGRAPSPSSPWKRARTRLAAVQLTATQQNPAQPVNPPAASPAPPVPAQQAPARPAARPAPGPVRRTPPKTRYSAPWDRPATGERRPAAQVPAADTNRPVTRSQRRAPQSPPAAPAAPPQPVPSQDEEVAAGSGERQTGSLLFGRLPKDLRTMVLEHLLVSPEPIHVARIWRDVARSRRERRPRRGRGDKTVPRIDARILATCKQAAQEGLEVLYTKNHFVYVLRDPDTVPFFAFKQMDALVHAGSGLHNPIRATRNFGNDGVLDQETPSFYFNQYAHLLRHVTIELESNRNGAEYEKLLVCALEALCSPDAYRQAYGLPRLPAWFPKKEVNLHTLTLTVSPQWEAMDENRPHPVDVTEPQVQRDNQFLSIVKYFSNGHRAMKALRCISTKFLHLNINVPTLPELLDENEIHNNGDRDHGTAHLETTIDMRYHPRQLERERYVETVWKNDILIAEQRRKQGEIAVQALKELRKRIEGACTDPIQVIVQDWWKHHAIAETERKERMERDRLRLEGIEQLNNSQNSNEDDPDAANDDENESDNDGADYDSDSEYDDDDNVYVHTYPGASLIVKFDLNPYTGRRRIRLPGKEHWSHWIDQ